MELNRQINVPGAVTLSFKGNFSLQCAPLSCAFPTLPVGSEASKEVAESVEHVGAHQDTCVQPSAVELCDEVLSVVAAQFKTRTVIT